MSWPSTGAGYSGQKLPAPAPFNVYALAENASAFVQWKGNHAGVPSTWTVTASPGGASATVAATGVTGSATVPGLTNGTAYTFSVVANNPLGASQPSIASNSVTPTALPSTVLPVTRGLEFWWSSAQVASPPTNGAPLTSLTDFSGNGYNAAGNGTGNGGTWTSSWSSAKPAVNLNGSNQYYHTLAAGLFGGMRSPYQTIYLVYDITTTPNAGGRVVSLERPTGQTDVTSGGFAIGAVQGAVGTSDVQIYNNTPSYAGASFAGTDITNGVPIRVVATAPGGLRVNGVAVAGFVDPRISFGAGTPWCFGAMYAGGYGKYLQGHLAEIIIFDVVHTPAEIALMETYLATRI